MRRSSNSHEKGTGQVKAGALAPYTATTATCFLLNDRACRKTSELSLLKHGGDRSTQFRMHPLLSMGFSSLNRARVGWGQWECAVILVVI
jgi:hypothetical protein